MSASVEAPWKESVGFLGRWCALAAGAAIAATAAAVFATAVGAAPTEWATRLIMTDYIDHPAEPGNLTYLRCWAKPQAGIDRVVMCTVTGCTIAMTEGRNKELYLPLKEVPAGGQETIRIRGNPYSVLGLTEQEATLHIVPKGTVLYLLDARMILKRLGKKEALAEYRSLAAAVKKQGALAIVVRGDEEELAPAREALRAAGFDDAMFCSAFPERPIDGALYRASDDYFKPGDKIVLVTEDMDWALAVHRINRQVVYVGPAQPAELAGWTFPSLAKLKDWIAAGPMLK